METEIWEQESGEERQQPAQPIRELEQEADGGIASHLQEESCTFLLVFYSTAGLFVFSLFIC